MRDGSKRSTLAVLIGAVLLTAVLLTMVAPAASPDQRGSSLPGTGKNSASEDQEQPATNSTTAAKAENEQNIKDAARLAQLAAEVKQELEAGGEFTLSVATLKKADEMEKLSKKLHTRMKADSAAAPKPPPFSDASKGRN